MPKLRKDCFFGLHFDYHANSSTKNIGKYFDPKVIQRIIDEVQPDFIQCDTKGHPGLCSYKTKLGNAAPGLVNDLLKGWVDVCKANDVAIYSHVSGLYEIRQTEIHPDWSVFDKEGKPCFAMISVFSDYGNFLNAQLQELAKDYKVDGSWVDGDVWWVGVDYSPKATEAFKKATGKDVFKLSNDELEEFFNFTREKYIEYAKSYCEAPRKINPRFQSTTNWFNTAWAPDVAYFTDYISGDLTPVDAIDSARFDGRVIECFHRNWDIMSWGISHPIHYVKSPLQLEQEASIILALSGGFQIYNMQSPDHVVMDEWAIPNWAKVSKYVRERGPYTHDARMILDIGLFYSAKAYYKSCFNVGAIFNRECPYNMEAKGLLFSVLDNGKHITITHEDMHDDLKDYRLIIVPNSQVLNKGSRERLLEYASNGGSLLLTGADTLTLFKDDLGLTGELHNEKVPVGQIATDEWRFEFRHPYYDLDNVTPLITLHPGVLEGDIKIQNPPPSVRFSDKNSSAFSVIKYGKGLIGVIPFAFGQDYNTNRTFEIRDLLKPVIETMCKTKVSVNHESEVEVIYTTKDGHNYLHIINIQGDHRGAHTHTYDKIPPVIDVDINVESNASKVVLRPENKEVKFTKNNGAITIHIDRLDLYNIYELVD